MGVFARAACSQLLKRESATSMTDAAFKFKKHESIAKIAMLYTYNIQQEVLPACDGLHCALH